MTASNSTMRLSDLFKANRRNRQVQATCRCLAAAELSSDKCSTGRKFPQKEPETGDRGA